jgi:2-(1,2-epoxy-1,2-dihydrophenyl)acetyl-CoA isomerase
MERPLMNTVTVEQQERVATITLDRPGRRNGVTVEMCEELFEALQRVSESEARVVILRGAGDDFSVGADLAGGDTSTGAPTLERLGPSYHASTLLHSMPQVTIAAVDGGCAGAALGWACACDFRFASDRARFSTAFIKVEVAGDMGLAWSLVRLVGGARARELLFFSEKLTGEQAYDLGLVTRLFPADRLHDESRALAVELAAHDPFALRMMKENVMSAERLDLRDYIEIESARHLHVTNRPEAMAALRQGRQE